MSDAMVNLVDAYRMLFRILHCLFHGHPYQAILSLEAPKVCPLRSVNVLVKILNLRQAEIWHPQLVQTRAIMPLIRNNIAVRRYEFGRVDGELVATNMLCKG